MKNITSRVVIKTSALFIMKEPWKRNVISKTQFTAISNDIGKIFKTISF